MFAVFMVVMTLALASGIYLLITAKSAVDKIIAVAIIVVALGLTAMTIRVHDTNVSTAPVGTSKYTRHVEVPNADVYAAYVKAGWICAWHYSRNGATCAK